jgi:hypothetical protein
MTGGSAAGTSPAPRDELHYAYKPSLVSPPYEFQLAPDALYWRMGGRSDRIPYGGIRRVRLSYRPLTMQSHRFLAEIWPAEGRRLSIASSSWKTIAEQERLDGPYVAFITELHRRMRAAGTSAVFETGSPPLIYWPGFAVLVLASLAMAALIVQALRTDQPAGALFVGVFLAVFLWWGNSYFRRNRPGTYRPDALPPEVLP